MEKVYIVEGQTISYDETTTEIEGVHTTEEGARKGLREEIDSLCEDIKNDLFDKFNDEDYAEDFEGYETFEEYWDDWVNKHFVKNNYCIRKKIGDAEDFWRYSDETDYTYVVSLIEKNLED